MTSGAGRRRGRGRTASARLLAARVVARGSGMLTVTLGSSALVVAGVATVLTQTGL